MINLIEIINYEAGLSTGDAWQPSEIHETASDGPSLNSKNRREGEDGHRTDKAGVWSHTSLIDIKFKKRIKVARDD